jgi:hypothetical protein
VVVRLHAPLCRGFRGLACALHICMAANHGRCTLCRAPSVLAVMKSRCNHRRPYHCYPLTARQHKYTTPKVQHTIASAPKHATSYQLPPTCSHNQATGSQPEHRSLWINNLQITVDAETALQSLLHNYRRGTKSCTVPAAIL